MRLSAWHMEQWVPSNAETGGTGRLDAGPGQGCPALPSFTSLLHTQPWAQQSEWGGGVRRRRRRPTLPPTGWATRPSTRGQRQRRGGQGGQWGWDHPSTQASAALEIGSQDGSSWRTLDPSLQWSPSSGPAGHSQPPIFAGAGSGRSLETSWTTSTRAPSS